MSKGNYKKTEVENYLWEIYSFFRKHKSWQVGGQNYELFRNFAPYTSYRKENMSENYSLSHLKELEAESIYIIREVAAEFENPVML